jgi:hypothetical protein
MNLALADIRQWLEDMIALRKLANVHIFNPLPALGMTGPDMDIDHALELGGTDPVHPTEEGYAALADSIKQFANDVVVSARAAAAAAEAASKAAAPKPRPAVRPKPVRREGWVAGSAEVAKRNLPQPSFHCQHRGHPPRGGHTWFALCQRGRGNGASGTPARGFRRGGRSGGRVAGGPMKRGFRGRGWRGRGGGGTLVPLFSLLQNAVYKPIS